MTTSQTVQASSDAAEAGHASVAPSAAVSEVS